MRMMLNSIDFGSTISEVSAAAEAAYPQLRSAVAEAEGDGSKYRSLNSDEEDKCGTKRKQPSLGEMGHFKLSLELMRTKPASDEAGEKLYETVMQLFDKLSTTRKVLSETEKAKLDEMTCRVAEDSNWVAYQVGIAAYKNIQSLNNIIKNADAYNKGGDCVICLESMEGKDEKDIKTTNCLHQFCKECLDAWGDMGGSACPICKTPLEVVSIPDATPDVEDAQPRYASLSGNPNEGGVIYRGYPSLYVPMSPPEPEDASIAESQPVYRSLEA